MPQSTEAKKKKFRAPLHTFLFVHRWCGLGVLRGGGGGGGGPA